MKEVIRKLTDSNNIKSVRVVWECSCKIGMEKNIVAYFFEKPIEREQVWCVFETENLENQKPIRVLVEYVRKDGFVFCSNV